MNLFNRIFGRSDSKDSPQVTEKPTSKDFKNKVLDEAYGLLKEHGFKKSGMNFSLTSNELIYFIQLQSSQSSTATVCKLTVNTGIVLKELIEHTGPKKPGYIDSHWQRRIGFYLDQPIDKWWTIDSMESALQASNEIKDLLANRVLPKMFSFKTTKDFTDAWLNGSNDGLSDYMRDLYLDMMGLKKMN